MSKGDREQKMIKPRDMKIVTIRTFDKHSDCGDLTTVLAIFDTFGQVEQLGGPIASFLAHQNKTFIVGVLTSTKNNIRLDKRFQTSAPRLKTGYDMIETYLADAGD